MGRKTLDVSHLAVVDTRTGEVVTGDLSLKEPRPVKNPYKDGFMTYSKIAASNIANDVELTLNARRVLDCIYFTLGRNNEVRVNTKGIADELGMSSQNVSRLLTKLKEKRILLETEPAGPETKYWRLNAHIAWVGDYVEANKALTRDPLPIFVTEKPKRKPKLKLVAPNADLEVDARQMPLNVE